MNKRGIAVILVSLVTFAGTCAASGLTAESLFRELPPGIFENTSRPLTEAEKEELLDTGHVDGWVIMENSPDALGFTSLQTMRETVRMKVFRRETGSGVVILSAKNPEGCISEVWSFNKKGGLIPDANMPEAGRDDYFLPGRALPPGLTVTNALCLDSDLLVVAPSFWGDDGALPLQPDKEVLLVWNGESFAKVAVPAPTDLSTLSQRGMAGQDDLPRPKHDREAAGSANGTDSHTSPKP